MFGFFNPEQWELSFSNINEVKEFLFRHRNLTLKRLQSKEFSEAIVKAGFEEELLELLCREKIALNRNNTNALLRKRFGIDGEEIIRYIFNAELEIRERYLPNAISIEGKLLNRDENFQKWILHTERLISLSHDGFWYVGEEDWLKRWLDFYAQLVCVYARSVAFADGVYELSEYKSFIQIFFVFKEVLKNALKKIKSEEFRNKVIRMRDEAWENILIIENRYYFNGSDIKTNLYANLS